MRTALILGASGQTGSYLSEHLLKQGHNVLGGIRSTSSKNLWRLENSLKSKNFTSVKCDVTDLGNVISVMKKYQPDWVFNLAAMSHVGTSFEQPKHTMDVTYGGCLNVLEAVRLLGNPRLRVYQASSSEMFGSSFDIKFPQHRIVGSAYHSHPDGKYKRGDIIYQLEDGRFTTENNTEDWANYRYQNEDTPFSPCSPYGVAKLAAHQLCNVYRNAYGMDIRCGIMNNHESVPAYSPVIVRDENNMLDVVPIEDIFKNHRYEGILDKYKKYEIWDGDDWVKIKGGTCYQDKSKETDIIQTRQSCCETTKEHIYFMEDKTEVESRNIRVGDSLNKIRMPFTLDILNNNPCIAKFIGFVVGDGYISESGKIRITGTILEEIENIALLLTNCFGWTYRKSTFGPGGYKNCKNNVWNIDFHNNTNWGKWLRREIYTKNSKEKRVPKFILNSSNEVKKEFFEGYYLADGRKGGHEKYKYKGFTTKSATLCLGMNLLFSSFSNQVPKVKCEIRDSRKYFYCCYTHGNTSRGQHHRKKRNEVIKIHKSKSIDGWYFDIQTDSQKFATGANLVQIHNSPRRGPEFVTKKVVSYIGDLLKHAHKQSEHIAPLYNTTGQVKRVPVYDFPLLTLGNCNTCRDWGHASEYAELMIRIMEMEGPLDLVIGTGQTHSVLEFVKYAFQYAGIDYTKHVEFNSKDNMRPYEVNYLRADASLAQKMLGWKPRVSFHELVEEMIDFELKKRGLFKP